MDDHSRIDELRRRVEKDPASIAFASLAEELRKAREHDEAIRVCRAGLEHHPAYLSARVTLGRALLELQQYPEARTELEYVLHAAPDNLLALKCMNELQGLDGNTAASAPEPAKAGPHDQSAPEPARPNLRIEAALEPAKVEPPVVTSVAEAAAEPTPAKAAGPHVPDVSAPPNGGPPAEHPAIGELGDWQARIQADRARRTGGSL